MGKARWTGWTMAIATLFVVAGVQGARADVASDLPAALLVYPRIKVDSSKLTDTLVRLTNTSPAPINLHCFYVNANGHDRTGSICKVPSPGCTPGWIETDFRINLTSYQPLEWSAFDGLSSVPIPYGVCLNNPIFTCGSDAECAYFGVGGFCSASLAGTNAGTRIPPVSEDPFIGELKCFAINPETGNPVVRNDLKGEAIIKVGISAPILGPLQDLLTIDMASYNAIGITANGTPFSELGAGPAYTLGPGSTGDYAACPSVVILNHFFEDAPDPVFFPDDVSIGTRITIVPCSEDFLHQVGGTAVIQYLVFNEFEQRFSTSRAVDCFQEIELCNIDTPDCSRSIFNINVAGTLVGQTRMNAIGVSPLPSKVLVVATEHREGGPDTPLTVPTDENGTTKVIRKTAAINTHFAGTSESADTITIP